MNAATDSDDDAVLPVSIGTGTWMVLLVVLLVRRPSLDENGSGWWIAVALIGFISGAGGVLYLRWRRSRLRRRSRQE